MNRQQRKAQDKARLKAASKLFAQKVTPFVELDLETAEVVPKGMTKAYRNNRYTVMVYEDSKTTKGPATCVLIQKLDNSVFHNHWGEIQSIKNAIFGPETVAVEYYPAESQLIDDKNIYWIWIYPEGVLPVPCS